MDAELTIPSETAESSDDGAYRKAKQRAEMIQGIYIHFIVFLVINAGLFALNWVTRGDDGTWWFQWPLIFWFAALLIHMLVTVAPVFSPEWVERRAQRMLSEGD